MALSLDSTNPVLLRDIGYLYYWEGAQILNAREEKIVAFERAVDYFTIASERNPNNTRLWGDTLISKYHLKQYDKQFVLAFESAVKYGPWEPYSQKCVAEVGLLAWPRLPHHIKLLSLATVVRGLQTNPKEITAIINRHYRQWLLCAYTGDYIGFASFCPPVGRRTP